jgi:hypothetical protein
MKILEEYDSFFVTDKTKYVVIDCNLKLPYFLGLFSSIEKCEEAIDRDIRSNNSCSYVKTCYKRDNYAIIPCMEDFDDFYSINAEEIVYQNEFTFDPMEAYDQARQVIFYTDEEIEEDKQYHKRLIEKKDE